MKALVYAEPNAIEWRDEPEPKPRDKEVLVKVEAVGICGSDMQRIPGYDSRRPAPLILDHEAAGRVLTGANTGKRVAINPLVTCGACDYCESGREHLCRFRQILSMPPRPGAFAEIVRVTESNLIEVANHLDIAKAALAEPVAGAPIATLKPISARRSKPLRPDALDLSIGSRSAVSKMDPLLSRIWMLARSRGPRSYCGRSGAPPEGFRPGS